MHYRNICFSIVIFIFSGTALGNECYRSADAETPSNRFKDIGPGVVTDTQSGLTWMRCPMGMHWDNNKCLDVPDREIWGNAKTAITTLNEKGGYGNFSDWRLPTLEELSTLIEPKCYDPTINSEIFPDTPSIGFWTSTEDTYHRQGSWLVYFINGSRYMGNREYEWAVRAVRK